MNIGLYGGTFSPVHNGHVRAARLFLEKYKFDKLIIMPAGIPPHKSAPENVSPELRLEMCRVSFTDISSAVEVSDFEIKKAGKSYTVETVEHLNSLGKITVLCGEDMLMSLHTWHRAEELMKKCAFSVISRHADTLLPLTERIKELNEEYGANIELLTPEPLEVSSSQIRKMILKGESIAKLVPKKVMDIIRDNDLYGQ